jgi:NAD(P)H dehydrogenase (quinone)
MLLVEPSGARIMASVIVVYHSGYGHTKHQAERVHAGVASVQGISATLLTSDEAIAQMDALAAADAIIFGCPTYMGGPSAQFKKFIDATGGVWMKQGWADKIAAGFTNSGGLSGDKQSTLSYLATFAAQHSMVWVSLGQMTAGQSPEDVNRLGAYTGAMAQSAHGSTAPSSGDLRTAELLGQRVARATLRWVKGK